MKTIATIITFLLISGICTAQSTGFTAVGEKLIWENVFISNETNITSIITRHSRLKIISVKGQVYKGVATGVSSSCPGTSKALKSEYNFDFEIEASEGKYRVTVSNIKFVGKKAGSNADKLYIAGGTIKSTKSNEADLACIDAYLNKVFTMTFVYKSRS